MHYTKLILAVFFVGISLTAMSQGTYFEVFCKKIAENNLYGRIQPVNGQDFIILNYQGKTKEQLKEAVLEYIKKRPSMWIVPLAEEDERIEYGDLATIGDSSKCLANLLSSTRVDVITEDGQLKLYIGIFNQIYASIYNNIRYSVSRDGVVVSDDDVPFNEYKFVQPASYRDPYASKLVARKYEPKLAYPESVFDSDGKVVNLANKNTIERFYDGYITDLKNYLDSNLK